MTHNVLISDEALFDITEASFWYETQKTGLSDQFQKDIKRGIEYLSKEPQSLQKRYGEVRIFFTKIFQFGIHYIIESHTVKVIAIFHTSKDPKNWSDRL